MAEYVAVYNATHEMLWRNLFARLEVVKSISKPFKIYSDNTVVINF